MGHIGATLSVATILTAGIAHGRISLAEQHATDVGVSYGLVAVAGLLVARIPRRWARPTAPAVSVTLVGVLLMNRTFTDLGHVVAWLIGLGMALLVLRARAVPG